MKVTDTNRAKVLAALYNASRPQGLGFLNWDPKSMTEEEAQTILNKNPEFYFDYLLGKVMKVNLTGPRIDFFLYDRDNGQGAGERACKDIT